MESLWRFLQSTKKQSHLGTGAWSVAGWETVAYTLVSSKISHEKDAPFHYIFCMSPRLAITLLLLLSLPIITSIHSLNLLIFSLKYSRFTMC